MTWSPEPHVVSVSLMRSIEVCCAIIEKDGEVLAAKRAFDKSLGGKWEFPGGKLENGEDPRTALIREIREEIGCDVEIKNGLPPVQHDYADFAILLIPFRCELVGGTPQALEHESIAWYPPSELRALDWADADLPILDHLSAP